jgi:hypothetical protein
VAYWLIKTEPSTWSWDDQVKAGAKGTAWEGVRNFQAKANLKRMKKGDRAFFYHTGDEKQIVGVVEVIGEYRKDRQDRLVRARRRACRGTVSAAGNSGPMPRRKAAQEHGPRPRLAFVRAARQRRRMGDCLQARRV